MSFVGTGRVAITLKFPKFSKCSLICYHASFFGPHKTGGNGLGSLVAGVGRVALPFAEKVLLPAVKSIRKELCSKLPKFMNVATKKDHPSQQRDQL